MAIKINIEDEFVLDYLAEEKGYERVDEYLKYEVIQPIIDKNKNRVIRLLAKNYIDEKKKKKEHVIENQVNHKTKTDYVHKQENVSDAIEENQNERSD